MANAYNIPAVTAGNAIEQLKELYVTAYQSDMLSAIPSVHLSGPMGVGKSTLVRELASQLSKNIHIHVPEGATPKDGPSAGITIATSIASAITQRKVRKNTAMTGEITLRGKVLPVGGIKEKILAAKRAGITDILMCKDNKKDIDEIPDKYLEGVSFHYVENVQDVWDFALTDEKVDNAINFTIPEENKEEENK